MTIHAEVASLEKQVPRADTEKAYSEKLLAQVSDELERRMLYLNVVVVGCNRAEVLTHSFATKSVTLVDAIVQQLGYDMVSRLR